MFLKKELFWWFFTISEESTGAEILKFRKSWGKCYDPFRSLKVPKLTNSSIDRVANRVCGIIDFTSYSGFANILCAWTVPFDLFKADFTKRYLSIHSWILYSIHWVKQTRAFRGFCVWVLAYGYFFIILNNCLKCFMPIIFEHSSTFIFANSKKSPEPQTKHWVEIPKNILNSFLFIKYFWWRCTRYGTSFIRGCVSKIEIVEWKIQMCVSKDFC